MPAFFTQFPESPLQPSENISYIDIHLARTLQRLNGDKNPLLFLATALVSSQTRAGHICLDLNLLEEQNFLNEKIGDQMGRLPKFTLPELLNTLRQASVAGKPGTVKPLIYDDKKRLYLKRYWDYQDKLAQFVIKRAALPMPKKGNSQQIIARLDAYFPAKTDAIDWQKMSAATAVLKQFCIIAGGPGTGKTHTVGKILAVLLEQQPRKLCRIKLAAPTGKAAVRLQQAIAGVKTNLTCDDKIKAAIPDEASTIHRLLGFIPSSPYFKHNAENPLALDVLVVDEASMIDLALMAKLVEAMPEHARLILLGDNNQLASVEAGAVLADLSGNNKTSYSPDFAQQLSVLTGQAEIQSYAENKGPAIRDSVVRLKKSYRFESAEGIGALSRAVNAGEAELALKHMHSEAFPDIQWQPLGMDKLRNELIQNAVIDTSHPEPKRILKRFEAFRILCALRDGPQGVQTINAQIEQFVKNKLQVSAEQRWYAGQPILIGQNDYQLNLFNGDVGVILADPENADELTAWFPAAEGEFRKLPPSRLPRHESSYAMTVHKSQGSEFAKVLLVLPEQDSPVLTRELIYTAITRASGFVEIRGNENVFAAAISRHIQRSSGLADALWES